MSTTCLLIGVSDYKDDSIPDLPFCKNDLQKFGDTLKRNLGLNSDEIFSIGEDSNESKRSDILRFIKGARELSDTNDTLIIYFTGHGASISNEGYLLTSDSEPDILGDTAISIERLKNELNEIKAKNKILFIDSCFSGIQFGKSTGSSEDFFENLNDLISEGWTIFSSCRGDEYSWFYEEKELSVFTYFLIQAFNGRAIKEKDSKILSFEDLNRYVTRSVAAWALEKSKSQTPTVRSERVGTLNFKLNELIADEGPVKEISNEYLEIELSMDYECPKGYRVDDSGFMPRLALGLGEGKWVEYSEERRIEKTNENLEDHINKLHAIFLNHIKPSEIDVSGENNIKLPFGELIIEKKDFSFSIIFKMNLSEDDKFLDKLLFEIDNQDFIKWEAVAYKFENSFDIDSLRDIVVKKNYKIVEYNPFKKITKVNITPDDDSPFFMTFKNNENHCTIEISEKYNLRSNFLELIPATEMIDIFKATFKNNT